MTLQIVDDDDYCKSSFTLFFDDFANNYEQCLQMIANNVCK